MNVRYIPPSMLKKKKEVFYIVLKHTCRVYAIVQENRRHNNYRNTRIYCELYDVVFELYKWFFLLLVFGKEFIARGCANNEIQYTIILLYHFSC